MGYDVIWAIIDRLTKERYYILCTNDDYKTSSEHTVEMLIKEIFRIYGLPTSIVSN